MKSACGIRAPAERGRLKSVGNLLFRRPLTRASRRCLAGEGSRSYCSFLHLKTGFLKLPALPEGWPPAAPATPCVPIHGSHLVHLCGHQVLIADLPGEPKLLIGLKLFGATDVSLIMGSVWQNVISFTLIVDLMHLARRQGREDCLLLRIAWCDRLESCGDCKIFGGFHLACAPRRESGEHGNNQEFQYRSNLFHGFVCFWSADPPEFSGPRYRDTSCRR
jgi:hypothetical protein